jgi:hypothetical protein
MLILWQSDLSTLGKGEKTGEQYTKPERTDISLSCCQCGRTRHYPDGAIKADQTERQRLFAVISWILGCTIGV